jgi:signal transduction histidine kinase
MGGDLSDKLRVKWDIFYRELEIADTAFIVLRLVIFIGGIAWLLFSEILPETFHFVSRIFAYFSLYSFFMYLWLFLAPQRKKLIYGFALVFDLSFASLLVRATGGMESTFFNGFYLITALYSFYYGLVIGTVIASVVTVLYLFSCGAQQCFLYWPDLSVRVAFLFLLAIPLGMLSQKLKSDKMRIEGLNRNLEDSIEELRKIQRKLIETEKLSALGRLTADVAHEIRNPLTSIGGFARRLNKKLFSGTKEKDYAEVVVTEVNRLERILRDVLTFSRETRYELELQGINGIIEESIKTFRGIIRDQNLEIVVLLDHSLPDVMLDSEQVRIAVDNLISNAVDVMSDGGRLTIKTCLEKMFEVHYVTVEITDTGGGLPEDIIDKIFEPFYSTKEIGVGTGLGLSICKNIIDEHNGLIFAESDAGKGTTVKMMFPYQSSEEGARMPCWEFNKCGVEKTEGATTMRCPAYPYYGRICWAIAGTFCGKRVSGAIAQKIGDCRKCAFYRRVALQKTL